LDTAELSRLARRGSGSASRSVPGGFVEWYAGSDHESSYAKSIAPADHWALNDCVAIVSETHKDTGSSEGHTLAPTSSLQAARVAGANERLDICRQTILERDFSAFARIVELDSNMMHAVMMTSQPPLIYWQPATLDIMQAVGRWREEGLDVCYTIDAGPNVHVISPTGQGDTVRGLLSKIPGVSDVIQATPGGPARLVSDRA
jgi:diphosphomevalonate decarboxylase